MRYVIYILNEEGLYDFDCYFTEKERADEVFEDLKDNLTYLSIPFIDPKYGLPKYILVEDI